jgi:hypothetical protein
VAVTLNSLLNELDQIELSLSGEHDSDIVILRMAELAPKFCEISGMAQTDSRYHQAGQRYRAILEKNPVVSIGLLDLDFNYHRFLPQ